MPDTATLPDNMLAPPGLPGADMTNIESVLGKIKRTQADEDKDPAVKAARAAQAATDDKGEKDIGDAYQKIEPYKPEKAPQAKDFQTSPLNQFGSVGSLFAVLASGFTHQPAINSMNAMAGAIKAVQAGDLEGYKTAYDAWKDNTQLALDRHKLQHEDYQDALSLAKTNTDLADAKVKATTAKYNDEQVENLRELGAWKDIAEIHTSRQNAALEMARLQPQLDEYHAVAETAFDNDLKWWATPEGMAYKAQNPTAKTVPPQVHLKNLTGAQAMMTEAKTRPTGAGTAGWDLFNTPDGKTVRVNKATGEVQPVDVSGKLSKVGAGGSSEPPTPEERESYGAQAATGMPVNQIVPGYGKDAVNLRQQVRSDAIKKIMADNNMSASEAGVELANRSIDFQSGKKSEGQLVQMLGATKQAVNQLDFNIEHTKEEMKKLDSSNLSPIINAVARGEEKWTGDPAYSSLFYYMHATAVESARILSGAQSSAAQLHQGAMQEAQQWASINMTPDSFDAVAKAMKDEGQNRIDSYEMAIKSQRAGGDKSQPAASTGEARPAGAPADAKKAPDGLWYSPDPGRPGKYLQWK